MRRYSLIGVDNRYIYEHRLFWIILCLIISSLTIFLTIKWLGHRQKEDWHETEFITDKIPYWYEEDSIPTTQENVTQPNHGVITEELADAIFKAENSKKWPYGIKWVGNRQIKAYELSESQARQICLRSIVNGIKRWEADGCREDFLVHFGRRFCPPKAHKLNSNWLKNVRFYLRRSK